MAIVIGTAGIDWIDGTNLADEISGLEGDDMLNGLDGDDILDGGDGADILDGGTGADVMRGGNGSDMYWIDHVDDQVVEYAGGGDFDWVFVSLDSYVLPPHVEHADVWWDNGAAVYGNALNNELVGWWGNDRLEGGAGNDALFGGSGSDILVGGTGNDRYYLNDKGAEDEFDTVIELPGGGIDTVELHRWTYHVLAANIENVEIHETAAITLIANGASNHITLGRFANTVDGGAGNDTIAFDINSGPVEVDLLTDIHGGAAADDSFTSIENVTGTSGDDVLRGTDGANILTGGFGADILEGRGGNDIYLIDRFDTVIEAPGGGTDEVRLMIAANAYVMPDEVERLRGGYDSSLNAWGNALNNDMIGGAFADMLYGGDGHDNLIGSGGNDILVGEAGHDMLSGGLGADSMAGGEGSDVYLVDNMGDTVTESGGEGIDTVYASLAVYTLPDHVENLNYNGYGAFTGTGNALDNVIQGGSGADFIQGGDGADVLRGNSGADTLLGGDADDLLIGGWAADLLIGGAGADVFRFSGYESGLGNEADRIADFTSGADVIDLSQMDADFWTAGDQAFAFIGDAAFSGTAGELRYVFDGIDTRLEGDTDGDGLADFEILVSGPLVPVPSDFSL